MSLSFSNFTPASGLLGGSLIGLSAATLLLCNSNVLAASSLVSAVAAAPRAALAEPARWRVAFLAAFGLTTAAYVALIDPVAGAGGGAPRASPAGAALAGLLVGFGTTLGSGCTSGHGICGVARGSVRSLAAGATFMATGALAASGLSSARGAPSWLRAGPGDPAAPRAAVTGAGAALAALAPGAVLAHLKDHSHTCETQFLVPARHSCRTGTS